MTFTKFENVTSPSSLKSRTYYFFKCCSFELIDEIDSFKGYSTMGDEHGVSTTCQPKEIKIKNNIRKLKNQIKTKILKIKSNQTTTKPNIKKTSYLFFKKHLNLKKSKFLKCKDDENMLNLFTRV